MDLTFETPFAPLTTHEAQQISPLRLAYVGDAVHDLYVRTSLLHLGENVRRMHTSATRAVNAAAQASALVKIMDTLSEAEADIVRRGRNAHAHHDAPKRANPRDYAHATALEALLGFLYITGQKERLLSIFRMMTEEAENAGM